MGQPRRSISNLSSHVPPSTRIVCRLRAIMHERGITSVKQLARMSGVTRAAISRLSNNTFTRLRRDILQRICGALELSSLDELFEVYDANIFYPISLHKEVTFHVGSESLARGSDTAAEDIDRLSMGAWDFRAMKEIHEYLNRTVPGIRVHVEEHERYDRAIAETLDRTFDRGNHIIVGSQIANQLAEEVVCRTHKVQPYSPDQQTDIPFVFHWDTQRAIPSSFGMRGTAPKMGIVSAHTGKLLAAHTRVTSGPGEDGALIMTYRVWREPVRRQFGRDDENIVIAILGYSGIGTYGGALVAIDRAASRELYPARTGTPLMRVVSVGYTRPPNPSRRDNREVTSAQLVSETSD
jgi:DNA-binding Xre family transcriptional regulator